MSNVSSLRSDPLIDMYATPEMRAIFDARKQVQYWLDVEAALARVQARLGLIPTSAAEEISRQARAEAIDMEKLRSGTQLVGYPILPLIQQLADLCEGEAGGYVHWGATTQDIMDTAVVLQLRDALEYLTRDLDTLINILCSLAQRHRRTVMAGRTHGQHALPITFGFKVAVWIDELRRHSERFEQCRPRLLRCQLGGAVGTLASLGLDGWAVHQALAEELRLNPAPIAWHTARDSLCEFVALCSMLSATLGKMANEVASLQKTEVAEVSEAFVPGKGSSSTMPQKRNPILCEIVVGLARLMTQPISTMLAAMMPEHERAMGEWHIEWAAIPQTCYFTAAALHHSIAIFDDLTVSSEAMQKNLALTHGNIMAESIQMRLATRIGRHRAYELMYEACLRADQSGQSLRAILLEMPEVRSILSESELEYLLEPANYIGLAVEMTDKIVHSVRKESQSHS